jgi:hypothetical protein
MADSASSTTASVTKARTRKPASRVRKRVKSEAQEQGQELQGRDDEHTSARTKSESVMGLAALSLAIVLGAFGFILHFVWIGAIVVMAMLWGSMISGRQAGSRRVGGAVSEVVSAAVDEMRDIADSVSASHTGEKDGAKVAQPSSEQGPG